MFEVPFASMSWNVGSLAEGEAEVGVVGRADVVMDDHVALVERDRRLRPLPRSSERHSSASTVESTSRSASDHFAQHVAELLRLVAEPG